MYLPSKITNILSKITKSYTVKYTNGKIESVFISEKDVTIQASNKGYCIYLKGGPIYLNDLKSIEPLLVKMNVLNNNDKIKNNKSIKDELIDIFSKNKDTFSSKFLFKEEIKNWIRNTDFEAVIWTNLGENWNIKNDKGDIIRQIELERRIAYLKELKGNTSAIAEEYIRRTPIKINTDFRKKIEATLNWTPIQY